MLFSNLKKICNYDKHIWSYNRFIRSVPIFPVWKSTQTERRQSWNSYILALRKPSIWLTFGAENGTAHPSDNERCLLRSLIYNCLIYQSVREILYMVSVPSSTTYFCPSLRPSISCMWHIHRDVTYASGLCVWVWYFSCGGVVCQFSARLTIASQSMRPNPNLWLTVTARSHLWFKHFWLECTKTWYCIKIFFSKLRDFSTAKWILPLHIWP